MSSSNVVIEMNPLDAMIITGLLDGLKNNFRDIPPILHAIERLVEKTTNELTTDQMEEAGRELEQYVGTILFKLGRN